MTLVMGDNFSEIFFLNLPINDTHAKIYLFSFKKNRPNNTYYAHENAY